MVNYGNSKIYKIEPICEYDEGDIYIGSTTKEYLSKRFVQHKADYVGWKKEKRHFISVFEIFEKYGVENCKISLLESYPCDSKDFLNAKEGEYIRSTSCINKRIAGRTHKEYYQDNKEQIIQRKNEYYAENKNIINEKRRNKIQDKESKERKKEYNKKYQFENKINLQIKHKEYLEKNKEKLKENRTEIIECECGCRIQRTELARHKRSQKHNNLLTLKA